MPNSVAALTFSDELSSHALGRNRITILNEICKLIPGAYIQVWLVEQFTEQTSLVLGYVLPTPDDAIKVQLRLTRIKCDIPEHGCPISKHTLKNMRTAAEQVFRRLGVSDYQVLEATIDKIFSLTRGLDSKVPQARVVGWQAIAVPSDFPLSSNILARLDMIRVQFSMLLEQSRVRRILDVTRECHTIFGQETPIRDSVPRLLSMLKDRCGAKFATCYAVTGRNFEPVDLQTANIEYPAWHGKFTTYLNSEFKFGRSVRRHLVTEGDALHQVLGDGLADFVSVPIAIAGRWLKAQDFATTLVNLVPEKVVVFYFFLFGKDSSHYLGGWLSDTDIAMCEVAAEQFSHLVSVRSFAQKYVAVTEHFEEIEAAGPLDARHSYRVLKERTPPLSGLTIAVAELLNERLVIGADYPKGEAAISNSVRRVLMQRARGIRNGNAGQYPASISVATHCDSRDEITVIYHLSTNYVPARFILFEFSTDLLDEITVQILDHFAKEAHLYFSRSDNELERKDILAQIRHAVIAPLAAAVGWLETYQTEAARAARTALSWEDFISNTEFRECVPTAITLCNQSLLLTQTGRYLISSATGKDLKITRYNIVELINSIRKAFHFALQERRLTFELRVEGVYRGPMMGDRDMLWVVISNLVDNAVKYAHMRTNILVKIKLNKEDYRFEIVNRGVYVAPDQRDRIFRPFVRGPQEDRLNRRPGTGLGLPVSQMLLTAHSNACHLEFWSEPPRGGQTSAVTSFWFVLPYLIGRTAKR